MEFCRPDVQARKSRGEQMDKPPTLSYFGTPEDERLQGPREKILLIVLLSVSFPPFILFILLALRQ
jgi:hypothetical protein